MFIIKNKKILTLGIISIILFTILGIHYTNTIKSVEAESIIQNNRTTENSEKLNFVLIHGSWADASQLDGVSTALRSQGHNVYVPELLGHGKFKDKNVTHKQITDYVVNFIKKKDLKHIILVGHSFGGSVVATVSQEIPDRLDRIVFSNAFVPLDGQSVYDQFPPSFQETFKHLADESGKNTVMLPFPLFRDAFVNTANLKVAKELYSKVTPEPASPLFQKLDLKKFYSLQVPKSYINLTEDIAMPPGPYAWHTNQSSHLGFYRFIEGKGDHFTTFKRNPKEVAQKFIEAGRP
jgi:pimeloyl-ACP methyl ester carboxylesterase